MDDIPLDLIPPSWLATAHEWAPWALGALVLATLAVRLLLPLARAVERWAITTPAAWDDGPSRRVVVALEWAAGASAAILALIPRLTIGDPNRRAPVPEPARAPTDTLLALGLAIVVGAGALTSGCGAGALGMQADLIAMGGIATAELDQALVDARAQDLDAVLARAQAECGSGGCTPERADAYRAELAERERVWTPALACRGPVVQALRAWNDSLETAARVNDDSLALDLLLRWGARFVAIFTNVSECIEAADPSIEVPDLPGLPPSLLSRLTSGGEA